MIQLYPKGQATFTNNGIDLHPAEAEVTWQDGGRYDFTMSIPKEAAEGITFDYGQILKVTVPTEHVGAISLGTVSYYETTAETPLYSQIPKNVAVSYNNWEALRSYMAGDKVTYDKKNWRCVTGHGGLSVPPPNGGLWTQIAGSRMDGGKIIATIPAGTSIMKVRDFNATYMEAATLTGLQGYLKTADAEATGESESRTIPAFTITEQLFTINTIDKETSAHMIRIEAEHISYQLGRTILDECNVVGVNPATALRFIAGAMQEEYAGGLYTNITDGEIEADWSWKNAQSAILDPQSGLLQFVAGRAIRDNLDVYIIPNAEGDPTYEVRYGVNMKSVKWTGDVSGIVTRIYPIAQREDGTRFTLPEKYIDSVLPVPYDRPEVLDTKLKIGQKVTNSDGTEVELTEDEVITRMRQAAQDRFSIDKCDQAEVTLELDWIHMPDTEEYRQYISLQNAAPADWVTVTGGPMGIETVIQMTGYAWDPILCRYRKTTFGDKKQKATISGFNIKTGAVSGRALAAGSVGSENIQAGAITAREIEANSITAEQIASKIITAELIAAAAITADEIAAQAITTEKLRAGAVTADKIGAHEITTEKLAAGAVTAATIAAHAITSEKIEAGAIDANKIAAGAITASKIDTNDLAAINATLGTAAIANAQIATADINFAHIKDLNAQSAFFGQTIFDEAVGGKLYVPRLAVGYAQMIGATIGDLVIQASNGNFYGIDVDMNGNVTATQRTVSAGEITAGHTTDGRTLVLGTDILATDLNTQNIYASHALMNEITAAIINVDELWARQAFINKLMVQDLSSNTYIQATIGDWEQGSTITQEIDSIRSRITDLGYGTVYFQPDEPSHSELIPGDIWIQSTPGGSWNTVKTDYATWQTIKDGVGTWQTVGGIPKMFIWDGRFWQEMYDALLPTTLQTEIEQLSTAINLRATKEEVSILSGEVTEFQAELSIQAQEIESAVSAVNLKAAIYVMPVDPRSAYVVSVGDIWIRTDDTESWTSVSTKNATWNEVKTKYDAWQRLIGSVTYVWDGSKWVETSDRATEIHQRTLINQTINQVSILAEASAELNGEIIQTRAELQVTNSAILAEVERATTAEGGKLDKTSQYQTAEQIVTTATSYVNGILSSKSAIEQTATGITAYVEEYTGDNFYSIKSGIAIKAAGIEISGAKYIKIKSGGQFLVDSGNFSIDTSGNVTINGTINAAANSVIGGWTLGSTDLHAGTGSSYVSMNSSGTYAIWAGNETAASAPFRVNKNGEVTLTKLKYLNANGTETNFNPRTGLWKLDYHTVKSHTDTSLTLSNGDVINFIRASSLGVGSGAGRVFVLNAGTEVPNTSRAVVVGIDTEVNKTYSGGYTRFNAKAFFSAAGGATIVSSACVIEDKAGSGLAYDAGYTDGWGAAVGKVGSFSVTAGSGVVSIGVPSSTVGSSTTKSGTITLAQTEWSNGSKNVTASFAGSEARTTTVSIVDSDVSGWSSAYVQNGQMSVSCFVGGKAVTSGAIDDPGYSYGYTDGWGAAVGKVGSFSVTAGSGVVSIDVPSSTVGSKTTKSGTITLEQAEWSNGSKNVTAKFAGSEARTTTVSVGDSSDWSAAYVQNGEMSVSCKVAGKTFNSGAIEDPGYDYGKTDGMAEYYNSELWEPASAQNHWTIKIPNATNTAAIEWENSGVSDAYDAGAQAGYSGGYDAGYNKAIADAGAPGGGVVYSGGTYYQNLYVIGQSGPELVGAGVVAPSVHVLIPR